MNDVHCGRRGEWYREGGREGRREGGREGGREGRREGLPSAVVEVYLFETVSFQIWVLCHSPVVKVIQFIGVQLLWERHTGQVREREREREREGEREERA